MQTLYCQLNSPLGRLTLQASEAALIAIRFDGPGLPAQQEQSSLLNEAVNQLNAYFEGRLDKFDLPLAPDGTEFQQHVWQALSQIPFGTVASYAQIARQLGKPGGMRAVGMANNRNPIPIIIPCHRVIGSGGKLVGYAGGMWRKEWLLRHEGYLLC